MLEQIADFSSTPDQEFVFSCYGVVIVIRCQDKGLLAEATSRLRAALLDRIEVIDKRSSSSTEHCFTIGSYDGYYYYSGPGTEGSAKNSKVVVLNFLESMVRVTVAEHAVGRVFIHCGVVARNGLALLFPGDSYSGKSTLVAELVRNGAVYYSDEYAVLDKNGLVHSFPRLIGMREAGGYEQTDVSVESLGGVAGSEAIPVGMVLITEYKERAAWDPVTLASGKGILEIIPHTISVRVNTEFALGVLNKVVSSAIVVKGERPDVKDFAKILLNFFDNRLNYVNMA